ncbi:MAG: hypothetical protein J6X55_17700 [Victivallales bacterium]|nr:hypothetical protein [Victivallales bacterium]
MRFNKYVMVAMCIAVTAVAQMGKNANYYLVDQRTQMPVVYCAIPNNWLAGGKTTWTSHPAAPVNWYYWTVSPDQKIKMLVSSLCLLTSYAQIRQTPFLQNPNILANNYLADIQRDHKLMGTRLVEARFIHHEPDQNLINSRIRQAREHGIVPTNFLYTELFIRYEGIRDGGKYVAVMSLPMLATENRPTMMSFNTVVELLCPMSFSCPPELEAEAKTRLEGIVKSMQMNQQFTAIVNQIAQQRTANWIRLQNEIHDKQMEAATNASRTQDRVRDKWSEYIRDVDTVSNPNTGEKMFVDNRYDHAWINDNNEVIYHNNGFNTPNASTATFDPNSNALFNSMNWRKLK